jgi:hypothetical protein
MDTVKEQETFLCKLASTRGKKVSTALITKAKPLQLDAVCEIILNTVNGVITITKELHRKLKKYKLILRKLTKKCLKKLLRKELLIKYFTIVRHLVAAVLPICGITGDLDIGDSNKLQD